MKVFALLLRSLWHVLLMLVVGGTIALYGLLSAPQATPWLASQVVLLSGGLIPVAQLSGSLLGDIEVEYLVVDDEAVRVEVRNARLAWTPLSLLRRTLKVVSLEAESVVLTVKDTPPQPPSDALTRLPFNLNVEAASIRQFDLHVEPTETPLSLQNIQLSADWIDDDILIRRSQVRLDPIGTAQLDGQLTLLPRAIELKSVRVRGWGDITLQSLIDYDGRHFSAKAQWLPLRWPQDGEAYFRSARGSLDAKGEWENYRFQLQGPLESTAAGFPLRGLTQASGRGSLSDLHIETMQVQTLGGETQMQGRVQWLPDLQLQAEGRFQKLNPVTLNAQWPGQLNGQFSAVWIPEGNQARTDLQLSLVRDSSLRGYPLQLQSQVHMKHGQWNVSQLRLQSGTSQLSASGDVWPRLKAQAALKSRALQELWPQLTGQGEVLVRAEGRLESPRIATQANFQDVTYPGLQIRAARLTSSLHPQDASNLQLEMEDVQAGLLIESFRLDGSGTAATHALTMEARTELGEAEVALTGALNLAQRSWRGLLAEGNGKPVRLSSWTLQEPAGIALTPATADLSPACWKSQDGRACMQFHAAPGETRGAFRLEKLAFGYFQPLLPPEWTITGDITGTGLLVDEGGRFSVEADLVTSAGQLKVGQTATLSFMPSQLHAEETDDGFLSRLNLPMEQGLVSWQTALSSPAGGGARRWSGQIKIDMNNLAALRLLTPEIESVGGRLQAQFDLSGAADDPRLQGEARLDEGRLRLYTPGIEITDLQASLRSEGDTGRYSLTASAKSGGGQLQLKGEGVLGDDTQPLKLQLGGEAFQIIQTPQAKVWVSPKLDFELLKNQAALTGEVRVPRARITPKDFKQGIGPSRDQVIVREQDAPRSGSALHLTSAVRIRLGDDVRFDGLGLKTRLTGALDAMDDEGRPTRGRGQIELAGGTYKAYGQDLTIETGRLLYNGGPLTEPAVELRATRKPTDAITVGLTVRGTLDAPQFSLFSTPALPQEQQLSWLILGRSLEEGGTGAAEQTMLSGAALTLGLTGGDYLAQKVRGGLRLDEISIGSKPGESSEKAKLTIGKYLSPKLYVSYGIGLFQPGHAFRLQYDIGRGFKLATETGVESGGDVLYTVEH